MFSRQPKTDLWYRRFVPVLLAVSLIGLASARAAAQDVQGPRRRMGEAFTWNMRHFAVMPAVDMSAGGTTENALGSSLVPRKVLDPGLVDGSSSTRVCG